MIHPPRPRPVTELFPESLRLSPKQRAVLDALDEFPNGAKVGEIAKALGMHTNTARGHLEELVAMEAVFAVAAPTTGRGRPQLIYKLRIPNNKTIADQYLALINIMAQHLEDSAGSHAKQLAQQIGREAGARLIDEGFSSANIQEAVDALCKHLRDMGFDPEVIPTTTNSRKKRVDVCMHSCPFVSKDGELKDFVCDVHQGMMQHHKDLSPLHIDLQPLLADGKCMVSISEVDEDESINDKQ
ncbi:helix-turn-helix transcriptional regulator [Corynebacterium matruchotii]|jgi:hypothetical protein|uniref:Aerobic repressor of nitrate reductase R n=1 Tax=Corynebacterium matruchotii TaxID=43768 RepID=A0A448TF55_9CORY|nr:helix-turn-helix domain-containing protein [Corynebacterium matruchotii]KAB1926616.1 helix-turn-helix domain-containing protein [Corynebacterium matruchotii]QIP46117.1 helix-turn-helix domain-containing protein [Corynebacterium matruchotii]SPW34432.1 Aerobic repressor of nitrate reductase R [Corynebacterium matruchotii]VEI97624.1 Aerobic repressor of nitrate reductase R [Corynebacterium matruchotii]